jgi:hypothetical protein
VKARRIASSVHILGRNVEQRQVGVRRDLAHVGEELPDVSTSVAILRVLKRRKIKLSKKKKRCVRNWRLFYREMKRKDSAVTATLERTEKKSD